jgi:hypothetical protein
VLSVIIETFEALQETFEAFPGGASALDAGSLIAQLPGHMQRFRKKRAVKGKRAHGSRDRDDAA